MLPRRGECGPRPGGRARPDTADRRARRGRVVCGAGRLDPRRDLLAADARRAPRPRERLVRGSAGPHARARWPDRGRRGADVSIAMAAARRDFLSWTSYRLAVVWQVLASLGTILMIYFAGTVVGDRSELIDHEGGSYVAFILVGLAFMDLLFQGMGALPRAIQDQQRAGTLEPMLLAPITSLSLLASFWLFRFLVAVFRMSLMLGFG